ncbi:SMC-Scp complex subunit ScpB [Mesorhizobium sp. M0910]|uniref:SMC-Scp complex subunit ScpB n=1 Tax=Mesorhizobium sp. M0910 TaxID=2957025 RepID=UPI00333C6895
MLFRTREIVASGPRSPTPGAPYTYVTTKEFLLEFGLDTLRDLPDFEALEDTGLLSKDKLLAGEISAVLVSYEDADNLSDVEFLDGQEAAETQ